MTEIVPNIVGIALLAVLVVTAGCVGILPGDDPPATPEEDSNGGTPETPGEELASDGGDRVFPRIGFGTIERQNTDSGVVLEGSFKFSLPLENRTFENVVVCLYGSQGAVLYENTTSLTGPVEWKNYSIQLDESPAYMVVDHPEFWNIEEFIHEYLILGDPIRHTLLSRNSLPFEYPRHNETGRCM